MKVIVGFFCFIISVIILASVLAAAPVQKKTPVDYWESVKISIYNPYRTTVGCEVKCDWNHESQRFEYWNYIEVKGRGSYVLDINKRYKRCEVWPKIQF